jgi:amino acid adenylation domain-containing protein
MTEFADWPSRATAERTEETAPLPPAGWETGPVRLRPWQHLVAAFEAQVQRTPAAPAAICAGATLDYKALDARANRLAHYLARQGVGRNDVVASLLPRGLDLIAAILGILKAGAAYMPLDPRNPLERNALILRNTRAKAVVSLASATSAVPPDAALCLLDRDAAAIADEPDARLPLEVSGDDLVYVINTSGSTGEPKSAAVYHRGFANLLQWYIGTLGITATDAVLIIGAATFDATQKNLFAPLLTGGRLVFPDGDMFDPEALAALIAEHGITWVNGTPSNFYPMAEGPGARASDPLASLRWVVLGGEKIQPHRLMPWLGTAGRSAKVLNSYGPTECADICAAWAFDAASAEPPIPLGIAIDNTRIAVLDEAGGRTPIGVEGELWIGGAGVGAGYLGRDDLNETSFAVSELFGEPERVYRTGDRVRWRADGVLEFLGRIDNQVKLRGLRIELGEIEAALMSLPEVREAAVLLREDGGFEPRLVAYLLGQSDAAQLPAAELRRALGAKLPDYFIPAVFMWLQRFPMSQNGKVDRRSLPAPTAEPASADAAVALPAGDGMEAALLRLWRQALGRDGIGLDDNFFDAGGSSLGLVAFQAGLARETGRTVPIVTLFANPTIRRAAAALMQPAQTAGQTAAARERAAQRAQALSRFRAQR